jgi:DNA ligase (NAD+)
VIAESIVDFFAVEGNRTILERYGNRGLRLGRTRSEVVQVGDKLKGKSFVVSGCFPQLQPRWHQGGHRAQWR